VLISDSKKTTTGSKTSFSGQNNPPTTSPLIKIELQNDLMSADLIIEPQGTNSPDITISTLLIELRKNGITYGIDETKLKEAVLEWNKSKQRYAVDAVARGTLPEPASVGCFQFIITRISKAEEIKRVRKAKFFWQTGLAETAVQKVTPGTVIAEKQPKKAAVPGKNIKNQPVIAQQEIIGSLPLLGDGVYLSDDGTKVISKVQGIAVVENDITSVLPIDFNGSVDLSISSDEMTATLNIHPALKDGLMPSEEEIRSLITRSGIVCGIDESKLQELFTSLSSGKEIPLEPVVIATGTLPVKGKDGEVVFCFDTEKSLKPRLNPDGSVDYKSISIITPVKKGQKLATLSAPKKGIEGRTVTGRKIEAVDGKPAKLPAGENTKPDPDYPDSLLSDIEGFVRLNGDLIEVEEGLTINGNVDFSTGNIKYDRDVVINGDVKSGFDVDCGGDLQVSGAIEDSNLKAGGSVLCRYGFVGQGKGIITAKGSINLGFMKNQTVKSWKNVSIAREAINCNIFAREAIFIYGMPLSAAGGVLTARDQIVVNTVGNRSGTKTLLEVGVDFSRTEELQNVTEEINKVKVNLAKLIKSQKELDQIRIRRQQTQNTSELIAKIAYTIDKYQVHLRKLEEQKESIEKAVYNFSRANIKINRGAFPGTVFKFGGRHLLLREEITGSKTVCLVNHEIKII